MLLTSVLMMSMFAVTTQQVDTSDRTLVMIENYFVNQHTLGLDHPRMCALREKIENETGSDFQFDLVQIQNRLEKLTAERKSLLRTLGLRHPVLVQNATRLALLSRLLAGQTTAVLRDVSDRK